MSHNVVRELKHAVARAPDQFVPEVRESSPHRSPLIILTPLFFRTGRPEDGVFMGGAERYLLTFIPLLREHFGEVIVIQGCMYPEVYELHYESLTIYAVPGRWDGRGFPLTNWVAHEVFSGCPILYFSPMMTYPVITRPSVVISHGVWFPQLDHYWMQMIQKHLHHSFWICNDTLVLNLVRLIAGEEKFAGTYIPNFVDTEKFTPPRKRRELPVSILYPRTLTSGRGFELFVRIARRIIDRYGPRVEVLFCGTIPPERDQDMPLLPAHVNPHFEEMPRYYQWAHIVVIPTLRQEGTSLACLEAMASGCAVVATQVGGLPDLIFHEYNGLLVPPREDAVEQAIVRLIEDRDLREQLGNNARRVAESFSVKRWRKAMKEVIKQVYA